ncbi:MAG: carbohydrate kinase family protein [Akkermansiaceae bacterium]
MTNKFKIAGIGEILWDTFPDGTRLGGAPTNFAFHSYQLGADAYPVSCVGDDELGNNTFDELNKLGVNVEYVQVSTTKPTGRVMVKLDDEGKPSYDILKNRSWDYLSFTPEMEKLAESLDAVCFGSLSQRSTETRNTIRQFIKAMPVSALKIFDVNLRKPFYSKSLIEDSLILANILKLSDEELPVLADYFNLKGTESELLAQLRKQFNLYLIAYTKGADGSILVSEQQIAETKGIKIKSIDTVGAGDSFTAALCAGLLRGWPLDRVNQFANKVAAFVCSQKGATPRLPTDLTKTKVHS